MVTSLISLLVVLLAGVITKADDDVWVWGRDTDTSDSLRGRQADDIAGAILFPEENSRAVEAKEIATSPEEPLFFQQHSIRSSVLTTSRPSSKSRAIETHSQRLQSSGNVQQIHSFVSNSGFKPPEVFPEKISQQLSNVKSTTVQQQQSIETLRNNQNFSPVSNALLSQPLNGPSSKLQIIPAIQTASISQTFGDNFPPFPEPSNNIQGQGPAHDFELRGRDQKIFGKSEPAKRSAITTENPVRSLAFVVPADISLLPLEEHEKSSSSSSSSAFQGRLLNSPAPPSSFRREIPPLSRVPTTNSPPLLTRDFPSGGPRKSILTPRFPPRENLLIKNLSPTTKINSTQSLNENILEHQNSTAKQNGGHLENAPRFTRTINHESQKTLSKDILQPNQIPVSPENTEDEEHAVYIIDIPNLETPKWPYTYLKNNEVITQFGGVDVDADANDNRAVGSDSYSSFESTKITKLTPLSIRTLRDSEEFQTPASELFGFNVQRDPKRINSDLPILSNPTSGIKRDLNNAQPTNNVNQNLFVPTNNYFPSETFQNLNFRKEQDFIGANIVVAPVSHGHLNNNLGLQPLNNPSDETLENFDEKFYHPLNNATPGDTGILQPEYSAFSDNNFHSNSVKQHEPSKDTHASLSLNEISSTYHAPLRVEIVKPNTLHSITDTVVDGKVITTFYDPLKVTIYKHGSLATKLYDTSSVENENSLITDLISDSPPSYTFPIDSSNKIEDGFKSGEVNHASLDYDVTTNTGIKEAFSLLEKGQQDSILSVMQGARGGYPNSSWKWPE